MIACKYILKKMYVGIKWIQLKVEAVYATSSRHRKVCHQLSFRITEVITL